MQRYSRFAAYLRPVASQIGLLFFLTVASMLITIPVPMWQRDIIDNAIPRSDRRLLLVSVSLIAAFYGLHYVLNYLRTLTSSRTKENVLKRIRVELYDKLQRMSVRSLARRQSGEMLSRILHDAGFVQHLLSDEFFLVIGSAVKVTILLYLMAVIHLPLTLLCLSLLPVAVAILLVFRKRVYRSSLELHKTMAALSGRMQENLAAAKLIQAQTLEQEKLQQTLLLTENLEAVNIRRAKIGISGNLLMSLLIYVPLLVLLWGFGGYQVILSSLSLGSLLAYMQYLLAIIGPLSGFFRFATSLQAGLAALDRVFEVLDTPAEIYDVPGSAPLAQPISNLRFTGVSLAFTDCATSAPLRILEGIDLAISAGEKLGIVGPTGAGKSSLLGLVLRFFDPTQGSICVNKRPLSDFTVRSVRERIVYVPQEDLFFNDSLLNNVTLGRQFLEEEVLCALHRVFPRDFIDSLPDGVHTTIGERGLALSGGQRQQLALARALLRNGDIYLFDEAFSALDLETERHLKSYVRERIADRMLILVAHRFSVLDLVDRVLVMASGRIVEQGTISKLLEAKGLFHSLNQAQGAGGAHRG